MSAIVLLTALAAWIELRGLWSLNYVDIVIFFLPYYGFLGERLRAGDIPGWNPHQFGGAPFAGDAGSGWMYLPVMILFTALPKLVAMKALVAFHLLLSGLSTYALARALRMGVLAAVVAATAYEFSTTLEYTRCCTAYVEVTAWLPVTLLGVELAVRARDWFPRLAAWAIAGFAISQLLAGYPGQGAAYALLLTGAFIAWRTLVAPEPDRSGARDRLADVAGHGAGIMLIGLGLAAAGLLPRLAASAQSTVAGGVYHNIPTSESMRPGWSLHAALDHLLSVDATHMRFYLGGATLALAVLAPLIARRRFATPFFTLAALAFATLTLKPTPLHRLLYLIPRFQALHEHYPSRALIAFDLPVALLAGATVAALPTALTGVPARWRGRRWPLAALGAAPLAALLIVRVLPSTAGAPIAAATLITVAAVAALLAWYAFARSPATRTVALVLLLLAVLADPAGWTFVTRSATRATENAGSAALLDAYQDDAHGAAGFLRAQQRAGPFRYAGYDPQLISPDGIYYPKFDRPRVPAVLVNNRATYAGLEDMSGYNPMQPARYRELIDALNGGAWQNYHQTNLLPSGFFSPLLNLLGVRYLVVPAEVPGAASPWRTLVHYYPTVYRDGTVRVLENRGAFPRAWIVHDARRVAPGQALPLMTTPGIDLRRTAVLETAPPALQEPAHGQTERVTLDDAQPDAVRLTAHMSAPGLVMVSDVYDPDWQVTVDGRPGTLLLADQALRAVPVPAGLHRIEMRYAPRSLVIGLAVTAGTAAAILVLLIWIRLWQRWNDPGVRRDRRLWLVRRYL